MPWTCPSCGRTFKNENQWHSCGTYRVTDQFNTKPASIVALYHAIEAAVTECGVCEVDPAKTAILIKRRVTFVSVKLRKGYLLLGIRLRRELSSPRIKQAFQMGPGLYENRLKLTSLDEVDDELRTWFCESWCEAV